MSILRVVLRHAYFSTLSTAWAGRQLGLYSSLDHLYNTFTFFPSKPDCPPHFPTRRHTMARFLVNAGRHWHASTLICESLPANVSYPDNFQDNKGRSKATSMAKEQLTVSNIFRRAQVIRSENPQESFKDLRKRLVNEFDGSPFPSAEFLTIPEQDDRAPEEDWTAGLPLVLRGIQHESWKDIANGIALCVEQVENYQKQSGNPAGDNWHDRSVGIRDSTEKGISKWMPEELIAAAERSTKH
jgi:hypothetical protein